MAGEGSFAQHQADRLGRVEAGGHRDQLALRQADELRVRSVNRHRGHRLPRLESGNSLSDVIYIAAALILPGRKHIVPYSIQTLKRLKPAQFREDLIALLDLLRERKIKPIVARRFPLAEARNAQEMLGQGGVTGKIVLLPSSPTTAGTP
jgi:hypothetical protein